MPIVHIENTGAVGIITDTPSHILPPEAWSDGNNVRFFEGVVEKFTGQEAVFGTPTVAPHYLLPWNYSSGFRWLYASVDKIYYTNGATHADATRYTTTPGDDDYTGKTRPIWTGGVFNGVPIMNHDNDTDYPQQWDDVLGRMKDLDNWQVNTYCKAIGTFKNFLVAVNITKSSVNYPYMVKWSGVADPGTVPPTWDETLATNLAGEAPLAETGGHLLYGLALANQYVLYKEDSILVMRFIGGVNVFSFETITNTTGILSQRCAVEFFKKHIVVGKNDVVIFDGFNVRSIIDKRNRQLFFADLHDTYKAQTVLSVDYNKREIWISYVSVASTSVYLDKALIWSWEDNTWAFRDLPDLAYITAGEIVSNIQTIDGLVGSINDIVGTFNSLASSGVDGLLYAKVYTTNEFMHGDTGYSDRGTDVVSTLERTGITIVGTDRQGRPRVDQSKVKFLRSVFPKISAPNPVTFNIYAGAQDTPGGAIIWEGPYTFTTGVDTKVDFMVSGKFLAVKFEETGGLPWSFDGYALDLDVISEL